MSGFEHYVRKGTKELRYGYTTGSCAALAAGAAVHLLLTGEDPGTVSLITPKGIPLELEVSDWGMEDPTGEEGQASAWAGIRKDAGDDPDITDGLLICARVWRSREGVSIDGGTGVGRVTKAGLDQPVGNAAINSGPRSMIAEQVKKVCEELSYRGGIKVEVFVPEGEEISKNTFNPNLGIRGGISILGTTGIVEPMSERALIETIELEIGQAGLRTGEIILTPGNYGTHYIEDKGLDRLEDTGGEIIPVVRFSNYLGDTLDMLPSKGIKTALLVGHAGKLVKVAGGIMNTHSSWADCRNEIICAHTAIAGGDRRICREIMDASTTDACFDILDREGILEEVMAGMIDAIQKKLELRVRSRVRIGAVLFSNARGTLGLTGEGERILKDWKADEKGVSL